MDASAVVNGVLDGQAIPATGGLPIMDSRVLDQQPEREASRMPSLTVPRRLHSDRGASFTGKLMRELAKQTGVRSSYTTTPYHPEGNAVCERYNRSLISMISTLNETQKQK